MGLLEGLGLHRVLLPCHKWAGSSPAGGGKECARGAAGHQLCGAVGRRVSSWVGISPWQPFAPALYRCWVLWQQGDAHRGVRAPQGCRHTGPLSPFASAPTAGCGSPCSWACVKPWWSEGTAGLEDDHWKKKQLMCMRISESSFHLNWKRFRGLPQKMGLANAWAVLPTVSITDRLEVRAQQHFTLPLFRALCESFASRRCSACHGNARGGRQDSVRALPVPWASAAGHRE